MNDIKQPLIVSYGGGVNSTAMLVEFKRRNIQPDLILFADTGSERPETYNVIKKVSNWCSLNRFPPISTCKHFGGHKNHDDSLEDECLRGKRLPSIAYGFKSCSDKWKKRPSEAYLKALGIGPYRRAIGFDAGESRRMKDGNDGITNWFPLIEWGIYREDCIEICKSEGLPTAKSSCFFCPSMKKKEIFDLKLNHPDLLQRALRMEDNAELTSIKGLGRSFSWRSLIENDEAQGKLDFCDLSTPEVPCGCYDG